MRKNRKRERHDSFLFKYGGYVVYLVFIIGLSLNGGVGILYFRDRQWLLGIWALFSILMLPKAALGFILIADRKDAFLNMPEIIRGIFPRTMRRYRGDSMFYLEDNSVREGVIKEFIWLGISFFPILAFLIQR